MKRSLNLLILIPAFTCCLHVYSQSKYPATLLWRISGNGLQKPSYLFGTMHLSDKRLFRLTDSVYRAIEVTDGLAIELNPDEMAAYAVNNAFDEIGDNKKSLRTILNEKDFAKHSKTLAKKFNKKADEITISDVLKEKNRWFNEYFVKGEMPTFLDAYLYSTAKKQGKWVGGIEDMADQAGLLENLVDKSDIDFLLADDKSQASNMYERMIRIYAREQLDSIEKLSDDFSEGKKDLLLIKRNMKMARRMDSLAAFRTMFFAVGAAHLPGKEGVIALLKEKGFAVDPVLSDKKIDALQYKFKEVPTNWITVKDTNDLYTVSMPVMPTSLKLFGAIDMKFAIDFSNMTGYITTSVGAMGRHINIDSFAARYLNTTAPGSKKTAIKKITKDSIDCRELIYTQNGLQFRLQIQKYKQIVYMAAMYANKKDSLMSGSAGRFFNSFTINKNKPNNAPAKKYVFSDTTMGIRFTTTIPLSYDKMLGKNTNETWNITAYSGSDIMNGAYIAVLSKATNRRNYILSDSLIYEELYQNLEKKHKNVERKKIQVDGYPAEQFDINNSDQSQDIAVKMISLIRNNRSTNLLIAADKKVMQHEDIAGIFNTIRLVPAESKNWKVHTTPDNQFAAWAPSVFIPTTDSLRNNDMEYVAYDTISATSFIINADSLNRYYWKNKEGDYWDAVAKQFQANGDSLVYLNAVTNNNMQGKEALVLRKGTGRYKRSRILLNKNYAYELTVFSQKEELSSDRVNRFFESFTSTAPTEPSTITQSKAALLLNDIANNDSATRAEAQNMLSLADFNEADIPLLHKAFLKKDYPLFEYQDSIELNRTIGGHLIRLCQPATVKFITDEYNNITSGKLKNEALSVLGGIHTNESYKALATLLSQPVPDESPELNFRRYLNDSLPLTAEIFPSLIIHARDSAYAPAIAAITLTLMDSGFIKKEAILPYYSDFLKQATHISSSLINQDDGYDYQLERILVLLLTLNKAEAVETVKKFQFAYDSDIVMNTILLLLKNNYAADTAAINRIAAKDGYREYFYDRLKEIGKESLFPKKFLTQKAFATSQAFNAYDDEVPQSVQFIKETTGSHKGEKYKFYLYKIIFGEGENASAYLSVVGGYALTGNSLKPDEALTGIYGEKEFDKATLMADFQAYLEQLSSVETYSETEEP